MVVIAILFLIIIGGVYGYEYTKKNYELQLRYQALEYLLYMSKDDATKWLNTKNPGCNLRRPIELNFAEMWDFASKIRK